MLYRTAESRPLGGGFRTPFAAITDDMLASRVRNYRRRVASQYRSLGIDEVSSEWLRGPMHVSPKIDGELWFMVFDDGDVFIVNPKGAVIYGDIPLLADARRFLPRTSGTTVVAGELWAISKSGRPRVYGVKKAFAGGPDADVRRLGFGAFDLLAGGIPDKTAPFDSYGDRLEVLEAIFEGGKRSRCVHTDEVKDAAGARERYAEWVDGGKAEGMIVRTADGRTSKVKPLIDLDAVAIGYTRRGEDPSQVRSVLLALRRSDDQLQVLGSVGNFGDDAQRREILSLLAPLDCPSGFRKASSNGAMYRFVRPEIVMQIRINDLQTEGVDGDAYRRMVLTFEGDDGYKPVRAMNGVMIIHPIFERIRDDKTPSREEIRIEQVLDRCDLDEIDLVAEVVDVPPSELVRREVWVKETKGVRSVRKLLVWRTHKHEKLPDEYPPWVVKFVDYSPGRRDPMKHAVKVLPDEASATAEAEALIAKNIKRGWEAV